MSKYQVGDKFKHSQGSDTVKLEIIFVPPVDGYGIQHYLCTVYSLYANGGDKMFLTLDKESVLDEHFIKRY